MPKRILAVDDDENILNLEKAILQQDGFEVVTATGSKDALAALEREPVDRLILNAALIPAGRRLTDEGIEETLAVNHLAPYLLGRLLLPRLAPGARIIVVGADPRMLAREPVALDDLAFERDFSPVRAYMRTKNMNAMFAYALSRRAAPREVRVNGCHPGVIRTSLARNTGGWLGALLTVARPFLPRAETGADTPAWLAWSDEPAKASGRFFVKRREVGTAPHTLDEARQEALWAASAALVGLPP